MTPFLFWLFLHLVSTSCQCRAAQEGQPTTHHSCVSLSSSLPTNCSTLHSLTDICAAYNMVCMPKYHPLLHTSLPIHPPKHTLCTSLSTDLPQLCTVVYIHQFIFVYIHYYYKSLFTDPPYICHHTSGYPSMQTYCAHLCYQMV